MELSFLSGKPVLSPAGEALGYVKQVFVSHDFVSLSSLSCADADEKEFILPARAVLAVEDAVIAGGNRLKTPAGIPCPVGQPVFNHKGAFLGRAAEFTTGENGVLTVVGFGGKQVYPTRFLAAGDIVIVYPETAKKPALRQKKTTKTRKNTTRVAKTQVTAPPPAAEEESDFYRLNLLGRRVLKAVLSVSGEQIAGAGETVTPLILQRARENNRLLELTANTLTE